VLFETVLLVLLLRGLGELRQQVASSTQKNSTGEWGLAVGEQASSFEARDQYGRRFKLKSLQGQRRILAFVAPGCVPCAGTVQLLNKFLEEVQGVTVLVVGSLDFEKNRAYALEHNAQIPILTPDFDVGAAYHVNVRPFVFAIDEAGFIRAKGPLNDNEHLESLMARAFPTHTVA
jgi:methylamine dehydrogenase accessory protein MauD